MPGTSSPDGADQVRSFAVADNRAARDMFDDALKFLAEKRYTSALMNLQRLLDHYGNKVVAVPIPDRADALYNGLGREVTNILGHLDPAGLKVYRELHDGQARRLFARAEATHSLETFLDVVRRFRHTTSGVAAVEAAGDMLLEQGDALSAAHFYEPLARSPDPDERRRFDPLKLAFAWASAGRFEKAAAVVRRLRTEQNRTECVFHGHRVSIASLLQKWSGRPAVGPLLETWPMFGGNASHTRLMAAIRYPGRLEWQQALHVRYELDLAAFGDNPAPFNPVVGHGRLYLHNGVQAWAYNLSDGLQRWTFAGDVIRSTDRPNARIVYSGALMDDLFVANLEVPVDMPEHYYHAIPIQKKIPVRKLYAFDADTGELRWSHAPTRIPRAMTGADRSFVARVNIPSPPAVWDGTLYCGASDFEGKIYCYLTAVDARTGHLRWRTLICTGQQTLNMFGRPVQEPVLGVPAVADGVVYFTSNLGVIGAVDARLGRILWLTTYPQREVHGRAMMAEFIPHPGWRLCPTLVKNGVLVTAPTDSNHLFGVDTATGNILWRVRRQDTIDLHYLLGVREGTVYASGNGLAALDLLTGAPRWPPIRFPRNEQHSWRGAVTTESIMIPTEKHLRIYDPQQGRLLVNPPIAWESTLDQAGNVLAVNQDLLITVSQLVGAHTVHANVFYNARDRIQRIQNLTRLERDDPKPCLALARTLAQAGLVEEAEVAFDQAEARARKRSGRAGERLVREAMRGRFDVLARLARKAIDDDRFSAATGYVDRALAVSRDQPFHLDALLLQEALLRRQGDLRKLTALYPGLIARYPTTRHEWPGWGNISVALYARIQSAEIHRALGQPAQAVDVLQEIIRHHAGAELPPSGKPARVFASDLIHALIQRHGRTVYAAHDQRARQLYQDGLARNEPERFQEVIRTLPNARVVGPCLLAYAAAARRNGDPLGAVRTLRQFFQQVRVPARASPAGVAPSPGPPRPAPPAEEPNARATRAQALVALIQAYRDLACAETAATLLDRLARNHADTRFSVDGGSTTGRVWAQAHRRPARPATTNEVPRTGLPRKAWSHAFPANVHAEVLEQNRPSSERELLLLTTTNKETGETSLTAFQVATPPKPVWTTSLPGAPGRPMACPATSVDGRLVVALEHHVLCLDTRTGVRLWQYDRPDCSIHGVAVGEGVAVVVTSEPTRPDDVANASGNPTVEALELVTGRSAWQHRIQGDYPLPPRVSGPQAIVTVRKNPTEISSFDLLTGERTGQRRLEDRFLNIDPLVVAPHGVLFSPDSRSRLELADPRGLETRWKHDLAGAEIDALKQGTHGCLVAATGMLRPEENDGTRTPTHQQWLACVVPDPPGLAWLYKLDPEAFLDTAYLLEDGDRWWLPLRDRTGKINLVRVDRRGRRTGQPIPLFDRNVFQTPLYRLSNSVLAVGFNPTAREQRNRPTVQLVMVDPEDGRVLKRWSMDEAAPTRGRGVWPTAGGFFMAWPDRLEYYDLGTPNVR